MAVVVQRGRERGNINEEADFVVQLMGERVE
jgi:hypothetical protein